MITRQNRILNILEDEKRLEVAALARRLGISQVTVRKDLDELSRRGLLRREHGFALAGSVDDMSGRLAYHHEQKRMIARLAARDVADGETVMIESGSCCALLAEELSRADRGVSIITNSAFIAGYLRKLPGARVTLLGGSCQLNSQVMVGPLVGLCAAQFFVDKLYVGTDGFTPEAGFTGSDLMRAEAVRAMSRQANRRIVLTESQKFSSQGVVSLLAPADVHAVYTDRGIPEDAERFLQDRGVAVFKVGEAS